MSIYVDVEDYCKDCPEFTATSDTAEYYADDKVHVVHHVVTCAHEALCKKLKKYFTESAVKYALEETDGTREN